MLRKHFMCMMTVRERVKNGNTRAEASIQETNCPEAILNRQDSPTYH